jgi:aryl-alcohol dehydrogenase-like predicted oxidoreductase
VSAIGFGAWGLSGDYGSADDAESIATIRRGLDLGITLRDTADEYGQGYNERLVGEAVRGRRDAVVLATKARLAAADLSRLDQAYARGSAPGPRYAGAMTALAAVGGREGGPTR